MSSVAFATQRWLTLAAIAVGLAASPALGAEPSELSDEPIPYQTDEAPNRPRPVLELGSPFLGTGLIGPGFELPGGAVWQPQLLIWGTLRSAAQSFDPLGDKDTRITEWRNRLDIFGELEVSPTERLVVGFRPLDDNDKFSGCGWNPGRDDCSEELNGDVFVLFAEGNLGEILPNLERGNSRALDIEFSVGRQPIFFQDGMLIDDQIDSLAITRNNITLPHTTNTRVTGLAGIHHIDRANNRRDHDATMGGLFIETDFPLSTINLDVAFVASDKTAGDSFHVGLSFIQRIGHLNTSFRALISQNFNGESPEASDGALLFGEIGWVPPHTHDNLYLNFFVGIDRFSSAARAPDTGGPLGRTGILFGAVGIGAYGAPLGSRVEDAVGGALGYQMFFARNRRWLTLELGGREGWNAKSPWAIGMGIDYQHAIGRRVIARLGGFISHVEREDLGWGGRTELVLKF